MTSWISMGSAESNRELRWVFEVQRVVRAEATMAERDDDIVQETLLRVWSRLSATGEVDRPHGLIRTVLRRLRIDRLRAPDRPERLEGDCAGRAVTPLDAASLTELRERVRDAIDALPARQREVVRLRVYEDVPFKRIAAIQGVPLGTALGRMHLAMKRLRAALEEVDHATG